MSATPYVHFCSAACPPWHAQRTALIGWPRPRDFTVDVHCHLWTPAVEAVVADAPQKRGEREGLLRVQGEASVVHNEQHLFPAAARKMSSLQERLQDMDATGVDVQVVSPSPTQYYGWAGRDMAAEIARLQNAHLAAECAKHPDRLVALGAVSLQHPDLAVAQLRHCVRELGMVGVEISSQAAGRDLDDPKFAPFWAEVAALDCAVFLHPLGTSLGERVNGHYLANIIGQPLETTIALCKLILCGLFDRHQDLKLIAAHGGGYLAAYAGRLDHAWRVRPETRTCDRLPSDYLRRIWYDTVVHAPGQIRALLDTVGASQLLVGTDYPFDMGMDEVHAVLHAVEGLAPDERRAILGGNAARLFGRWAEQVGEPGP